MAEKEQQTNTGTFTLEQLAEEGVVIEHVYTEKIEADK